MYIIFLYHGVLVLCSMRKISVLLILFCSIVIQSLNAQITQLELASGSTKTDFTSFSIHPITAAKTVSLATLAFFQKFHQSENEALDESGVQTTAFYRLTPSLSTGPSLYHNSAVGFSERISILYSKKTKRFVLNAIPSVAHLESTNFVNGELFIQLQYIQPLKNQWNALVSANVLTHWDEFSRHSRSFQQVRAGLIIQDTQFGLALDFDQYGPDPLTKTSIGLFLRKTFVTAGKKNK